ncbi:hypothetical protein FB451DRAFT_1404462 [Mycena latifolia]|nr:hypothetical protein FB451DRAFT_1404462 [Mycena latifolia]
MVVFDTLCTLATCFETQLSLIVFPDDLDSVELLKPLAALIYTTYATALVEQYFLCTLYFLLTKNLLVTALLALMVLAHLGLVFTSATLLLTTQSVFDAFMTTLIGAIFCAGTDMLIAFCLCLKFWQMMTRCSPEGSTRSLIQRIMIMTISSGATTGLNTLIMMILLLKQSPAFQLFLTCQGRIYSLTLLGNFLLGMPFNPASDSVAIQTNPSSRVGTNLVFPVNASDTGLRGAPPPARGRNPTSLDNSPRYVHHQHQLHPPMSPLNNKNSLYVPQYEERIDLRMVPSLSLTSESTSPAIHSPNRNLLPTTLFPFTITFSALIFLALAGIAAAGTVPPAPDAVFVSNPHILIIWTDVEWIFVREGQERYVYPARPADDCKRLKALLVAAALLSLFILMPGSLDQPPPSFCAQLAYAFPCALLPSFPSALRRAAESWDALHSSYEHFVLDDPAALNLTLAFFGSVFTVVEAYAALPLPVLRADFFRYLILLARGGVYSDIDTHTLQPADLWVPAHLGSDAGLVVGVEADPDSEDWHKCFAHRVQFCQWTLRAKAGHPVLREAVARITEEALRLQRARAFDTGGEGLDVLELTGPGVWTDRAAEAERIAYSRFTRLTAPTTARDVAVLPITALSPGVGWTGARPVNDPVACVWHMFEGSWKHAPPVAPLAPSANANTSGSADARHKARHDLEAEAQR